MAGLWQLGPDFALLYDELFTRSRDRLPVSTWPVPLSSMESLERGSFFTLVERWATVQQVASELLRAGHLTYEDARSLVAVETAV